MATVFKRNGRGPWRVQYFDYDPKTGRNVKWVVDLGTSTYATPVVAQGKVLIGTNNARPRDPRIKGDRGVLVCLRESDGKFIWQLTLISRLVLFVKQKLPLN